MAPLTEINTTQLFPVAYQVIKTIKGNKYLYQQESYRIGTKVKTRSFYLGAINPRTGELSSTRDTRTLQSTTGPVAESRSGQQETDPPQITSDNETEVNTTKPPEPSVEPVVRPNLQTKGDLAKHQISVRALESRHRAFVQRMEEKGIDVSTMPKITATVGRGSAVTSKYKRGANDFVVTYPKKGANRSEYRREVYRAFARSGIEAMRTQNPERFLKLSLHFDRSFRATQSHLMRYVMLGKDRNRIAKVISLWGWGNMAQLQRNVLDPQRVGVVDFTKRKSWEHEAVSIYAEMEQKGPEKFLKNAKTQFGRAKGELISSERDYLKTRWWNPRRRKARNRYLRAQHRMATQHEMMRKVRLVNHLLG